MVWSSENVLSPVLTVTVDVPASSLISFGSTERLSSGGSSSSSIVRVTGEGGVGRAPADKSPETAIVLPGSYTSLSSAVIVTVPVLSVAFAAKVRTVFVLTLKSLATAGSTAAADTVTVNGSADPSATVAVTAVDPPFSSIESGVSTSVTGGAASVRHTGTLSSTTYSNVFL